MLIEYGDEEVFIDNRWTKIERKMESSAVVEEKCEVVEESESELRIQDLL